ncbi:hypothetical protein BH09ACT8_BH09ACT8_04470 [soil metagenome]
MKVHMDWYDRSIVLFVLDTGLLTRPSNSATVVEFGMDARRIAQRFDAVLRAYASNQFILDDADLELVRRAVRYRDSVSA